MRTAQRTSVWEHLGTSENIWEHLGTSENIWEHLRTSWNICVLQRPHQGCDVIREEEECNWMSIGHMTLHHCPSSITSSPRQRLHGGGRCAGVNSTQDPVQLMNALSR